MTVIVTACISKVHNIDQDNKLYVTYTLESVAGNVEITVLFIVTFYQQTFAHDMRLRLETIESIHTMSK